MKLKDCIPQIDDDFNFDTWDPKEIIEVLWDNGKPYPDNILQFGENKKLMDRLIDDLIIGIVNANQVPLIQDLSKRGKRNEKSSLKLEQHKVSLKRKHEQSDFFKAIRKTMNKGSDNYCTNCESLNEKLKQKNVEIEILQNELAKIESSLQETKRKYKEMKLKYKEKKRQMKEENKEVQGEMVKFGLKTIPAAKLALCRTDYSKYVGDLLDICFGRETLSESVLKCSKRHLKRMSWTKVQLMTLWLM
ncbi:hypothetical protein AVEN_249803-1 [Araneus ventricosus]|uniref:BEN domain-containing protein n=2 Tax=Araneus ventricosus TaxID=182803 RepID=A0A4Y2W3X6_ARAVE|nr:hypothetical protein AVEN_249803-1 [Araneus ventricosus]